MHLDVIPVSHSVIHSGIAWIEFLNSSDNLGEILTYLREGDMKGAQLIWLRYEVPDSSVHSMKHNKESYPGVGTVVMFHLCFF